MFSGPTAELPTGGRQSFVWPAPIIGSAYCSTQTLQDQTRENSTPWLLPTQESLETKKYEAIWHKLRPKMSSWIWCLARNLICVPKASYFEGMEGDSCDTTMLWLRKVVTRLYCGYGKWSHDYTVATESGHTIKLWKRRVVTRLYCGYGKWSLDYTVATGSGHTTILGIRKVVTRLYCGYGKWSHYYPRDTESGHPIKLWKWRVVTRLILWLRKVVTRLVRWRGWTLSTTRTLLHTPSYPSGL